MQLTHCPLCKNQVALIHMTTLNGQLTCNACVDKYNRSKTVQCSLCENQIILKVILDDFPIDGETNYICDECAKKARNTKMLCQGGCGTELAAGAFCSDECSTNYHAKATQAKKYTGPFPYCKNRCGMVVNVAGTTFCSEACRVQYSQKALKDTDSKEEFFSYLKENAYKCLRILESKNVDYVGASFDPFVNFRNPKLKALLDTLPNRHPDDVEVSLFDLISIKFNRSANLLFSKDEPKNESLEDSFDDLMNYVNLLKTYRQMKETL